MQEKPTSHGSNWSTEELQHVVTLFNAGMLPDQIAEEMGRSDKAIKYCLARLGLADPPTSAPVKPPAPVEPSSATKLLMLQYRRAYKEAYGVDYWAAQHAVQGHGNPRIVEEFDRLGEFLRQKLHPTNWENYMRFVLQKGKTWKDTARPSALIKEKLVLEFPHSSFFFSKGYIPEPCWSPDEGELPNYEKLVGKDMAKLLGLIQ